MPLTANGLHTSDPAGGEEAIDVVIDDDRVQIAGAYPLEDPAGGVAARIGVIPSSGYATPPELFIRTPATVGGVDMWYCGRAWHSMIDPSWENRLQDTDRWFWDNTTLIPAASEVTIPHTLEAIPDLVACNPLTGADYSGIDWAVTEISDTQFKVSNWDGANDITVDLRAVVSHSIEAPIGIQSETVTLNGAAPQVIVPDLGIGRVPDMVFAFPYSPLAVQPAGLIVMDVPPDGSQVTLRNVAGGNLDAMVYLLSAHSIQG